MSKKAVCPYCGYENWDVHELCPYNGDYKCEGRCLGCSKLVEDMEEI